MRRGARITVIVPALNEAQAIGHVIGAIPHWVDEVVVVDNGSTDGTARVASGVGARVVPEPERGYGAACLAGLAAMGRADVVVFLDGDFSDFPEDMDRLVDPIVGAEADMVLGARVAEAGALTPQQRIGNWIACLIMRAVWRARYTDLGPFRAIRSDQLCALEMRDRGYGWTIEMQIKAVRRRLRIEEVPVRYRPRIGQSKISGTLRGVIGASAKICWVIATLGVRERLRVPKPSVRQTG